jgi:hypothetical protein
MTLSLFFHIMYASTLIVLEIKFARVKLNKNTIIPSVHKTLCQDYVFDYLPNKTNFAIIISRIKIITFTPKSRV